MKAYAIGYPQPGGGLDIDERDFLAESLEDLLLCVRACGVSGVIEVLEYVDTVSGWEEFSFDDMLDEQDRLN